MTKSYACLCSPLAIATTLLLLSCASKHVNGFQPLLDQRVCQSRLKTHRSSQTALRVSRREAFEQSSAWALSNLLLSTTVAHPSEALAAESSQSKTIVITGANSGVGFEAIKRLAADTNKHTIVLACRTLSKAQTAMDQICSDLGSSCEATLLPAECDLTSKASIASFAKSLPDALKLKSSSSVDTLCLNAGLARNTAATDVARTVDGFELTVGTNHFGHVYLQHAMQNSNALLSPNAHIVVTASGVHDPASPGGAQGIPATLGNLKGLESQGAACEMLDGGAFNADKAYKDSKLCNVLYTRELQKRLKMNEKTRGMIVNCFNPGLIVGTNFFRDQNKVFTKVFDLAATNLLKVGETPEFGGGCLAYMTQVTTAGGYYTSPPGSVKYGDAAYGNQFTADQVSVEARDDAKATKLWDLSEKALGIA